MEYENTKGIVFNIQRYSTDDGPGVRTTVFLKGCPLRCLWCSNPESQSYEPQLSYRYTSCKKCGKCIAACPNEAISMGEESIVIDRSKCVCCGTCVKKCLPEALSITGKTMTAREAFSVVVRDKDYYEDVGGCTCSGGEILSQPDFVAALFRLCRENGIHTNADTSGYGSQQALEKIMEYADMFYYDLKHLDPDEHLKYTGVSNQLILDNLRLIVARGIPVVIRVPLIPGFNDSEQNVSLLAKTVKDIAPDSMVNLLPYHEYGKNKYNMVGMEYPMPDVPSVTEEDKARARTIIESYGLTCKIS